MYHESTSASLEYAKFTGIMLGILLLSAVIEKNTSLLFMSSFMGVFFIVFAAFKLVNLKVFAAGFQSYDIIAKRSLQYAYVYPFLQLVFGVLYLVGYGTSVALNAVVIFVSLVSSLGVLRSLRKKQMVHCVCLGNVIKLPLSTISFVEDFGMAAMALYMIFLS